MKVRGGAVPLPFDTSSIFLVGDEDGGGGNEKSECPVDHHLDDEAGPEKIFSGRKPLRHAAEEGVGWLRHQIPLF